MSDLKCLHWLENGSFHVWKLRISAPTIPLDTMEKVLNHNKNKIKAMLGMPGGGENVCGWLFMMELLRLG